MPEDMPVRVPEEMPDRMPEDMSDRMPEDLPVTKCINVMVGITRSKVICLVLDPPGCPNHQSISGWLQCSKPMFVHHHSRRCLSPRCAVCFEGSLSREENPLFDLSLFVWRPQFAHAPAKNKHILQNLR